MIKIANPTWFPFSPYSIQRMEGDLCELDARSFSFFIRRRLFLGNDVASWGWAASSLQKKGAWPYQHKSHYSPNLLRTRGRFCPFFSGAKNLTLQLETSTYRKISLSSKYSNDPGGNGDESCAPKEAAKKIHKTLCRYSGSPSHYLLCGYAAGHMRKMTCNCPPGVCLICQPKVYHIQK